MSAYVCTEHTTEPVTWKGTGCRRCENTRSARQRDRALTAEWKAWRDLHGELPANGERTS